MIWWYRPGSIISYLIFEFLFTKMFVYREKLLLIINIINQIYFIPIKLLFIHKFTFYLSIYLYFYPSIFLSINLSFLYIKSLFVLQSITMLIYERNVQWKNWNSISIRGRENRVSPKLDISIYKVASLLKTMYLYLNVYLSFWLHVYKTLC